MQDLLGLLDHRDQQGHKVLLDLQALEDLLGLLPLLQDHQGLLVLKDLQDSQGHKEHKGLKDYKGLRDLKDL